MNASQCCPPERTVLPGSGPVVDFCPGGEYQEENRLWQGCPTVLCTPKGILYAGWYSGGSKEPSLHNYNLLVRSFDGGKNWSSPLLVTPGDPASKTVSIDVQLWLDPKKRMWLFFTRRHYGLLYTDPAHLETWAMVCADPEADRLSWTEPRMVAPGFLRCQPTVLSDGRWLLCAYDWLGDRYHYSESSDEGVTWIRREGGRKKHCDFDETMIFEKRDGSLVMFARCKPWIVQCISRDGGATWSDAEDTGFPSSSTRFFVRRLRSGNLLMIFNDCADSRSRMTAALSADDGASWPWKLELDPREKVTYPDAVQMPDGSIFLLYDHGRTSFKEIIASRFTEADVQAGRLVDTGSFRQRIISKAPELPRCGETEKNRIVEEDAALIRFMEELQKQEPSQKRS